MAITINEGAQKAGVSIKTVSRVLNDEAGVSESTRELVRQAIQQLGYVPNASARRRAYAAHRPAQRRSRAHQDPGCPAFAETPEAHDFPAVPPP